jgi:hypothetical protein
LHEFRAAYSAFPIGQILDGEAPDFALKTTEETIGFEIREFVRGASRDGGSPKREREMYCKDVTSRARQAYEKIGIVPVAATFHWRPYTLTKGRPDLLALEAAKLIAVHAPTAVYGRARLDYEILDGTALEGEVRLISLVRPREGAENSFVIVDSDFIGVGSNPVQDAIDDKNGKVADYRRKCDQVWLILWAGRGNMSSNAALHEEAIQQSYRTHFDRVFFFDRFGPSVLMLQTLPE